MLRRNFLKAAAAAILCPALDWTSASTRVSELILKEPDVQEIAIQTWYAMDCMSRCKMGLIFPVECIENA